MAQKSSDKTTTTATPDTSEAATASPAKASTTKAERFTVTEKGEKKSWATDSPDAAWAAQNRGAKVIDAKTGAEYAPFPAA